VKYVFNHKEHKVHTKDTKDVSGNPCGAVKNNNFLKTIYKEAGIANFLFPLHQFFEMQEYRFFFQG